MGQIKEKDIKMVIRPRPDKDQCQQKLLLLLPTLLYVFPDDASKYPKSLLTQGATTEGTCIC